MACPVALNACAPSTGATSDTGKSPSEVNQTEAQASVDSAPTSVDSPTSVGADSSRDGGQGGAGSEDACALAFEQGDCDAAIAVYAHNPERGYCEPKVYGGCGGNDNRFATYMECVHACNVRESGMACEVEGIIYPDGWSSVPDPFSCNSCICIDGEVNTCTQGGCTQDCPAGTAPGTTCAVCGPTDACLVLETGCLTECDTGDAAPCPNGGVCLNGLCGTPCG